MGRGVVRTARRPYTRRWVSAQPSASEVDEASRTKTPSPSGRLLLRMPPDLHGDLAQAAEREGTSLNGYIIARLSESVGRPRGRRRGRHAAALLRVAHDVDTAPGRERRRRHRGGRRCRRDPARGLARIAGGCSSARPRPLRPSPPRPGSPGLPFRSRGPRWPRRRSEDASWSSADSSRAAATLAESTRTTPTQTAGRACQTFPCRSIMRRRPRGADGWSWSEATVPTGSRCERRFSSTAAGGAGSRRRPRSARRLPPRRPRTGACGSSAAGREAALRRAR